MSIEVAAPDTLTSCVDVVHAAVVHIKIVTSSLVTSVLNTVNLISIMAVDVKVNTQFMLLT